MKKLIVITLFNSLLMMCIKSANAQKFLSDHKGQTLFEIPTSQPTPEIALNSIGITSGLPFLPMKTYQYVTKESRKKTMIKSRQFFGNVTFFNDNEDESLVLNKKAKIRPFFELGWTTTIEDLQNPSAKSKGFYFTFTGAASIKRQKFDTYDKTILSDPFMSAQRWSPGLRLGLNIFHKDQYAIAFNSSYSNAFNTDKLTSYQKITPEFFNDSQIAINGETDGYLAPVKAKHLFKQSLAVPIFAGMAIKEVQLIPTPYYSITYSRFNKPTHYAGIGLSLFSTPIYGRTSAGGNRSFGDAIAFSAGMNLINSSDKGNGRFAYLSGTIKLGSFKKPKPGNAEKDNYAPLQ